MTPCFECLPTPETGASTRAGTQTRTETRFRRCSSASKITNIALFGRACTADRATVNSRAENTDKELAVEPGVSRQSCSRTNSPIEVHIVCRRMIADPAGKTGHFRTSMRMTRPARSRAPTLFASDGVERKQSLPQVRNSGPLSSNLRGPAGLGSKNE